MVGGVAAVGGAVVGIARYRRLRRFATTDDLTGLPNRHQFERRAANALRRDGRAGGRGAADRRPHEHRQGRPASVGSCLVVIDLDGFKAVNDGAGHAAGDRVLAAVGEHLRRSVRRHDLVARWGGDEFVVLLVGVADRDAAERRIAALLADLGARVGAPDSELTATFGVAVAPADGERLEDLLAVADSAMYAAKPRRHSASALRVVR